MNMKSFLRRDYLLMAISGCLFVGVALYSYQRLEAAAPVKDVKTAMPADTPSRDQHLTVANATNSHRARQIAGEDAKAQSSLANLADAPTTLLIASEVQRHLHDFFARVDSSTPPSRVEQDIFAAQLLASIESSGEARQAVADAYRAMPASQAMERDMLRGMLVTSPQGRALVLDEANQIWASKDKGLYGEMYDTYFNLPGQAPQDVYTDALATLNAPNTDQQTEIAALNFIGTLENDASPGADALRRNAMVQLNSLASGDGDALVRALAVQKIYRLSTPDAAADVAVHYIAQGASSPLVMETLNAVRSGDVQLTTALRSTLATAVARPSASSAERQRFAEVTGAGQ